MKSINNVAIFFGGTSNERSISIKSGYCIFKCLLKKNINIYLIDIKYFCINSFLKKKIDKVFIALHGKIGEDGVIQGFLDFLKIPYTGSGLFTSSLCINKYNTKNFLNNFKIKILPHVYIKKIYINNNINKFFKLYKKILLKLNIPFIVKPNIFGSSIGLNIINNFNDFKNYFSKFNIINFNNFIFEKYIFGDEYTVSILNNKILCPIKIKYKNKIFNFNLKYDYNNFFFSININNNIKRKLINISKKIWNILNCKGCIRIDYIIDKFENIWFLEVNTIPGMTNKSLVTICAKYSNIEYSKLILNILYN